MIRRNAFPKVLKLRTEVEFQSVYERGAKKTSRSFVVFVLVNGREYSRYGMTTPRRLGNAIVRNRIKRRIREILRSSWRFLPRGFDIVVNPRRSVYERDFTELRSELVSLLGVTA